MTLHCKTHLSMPHPLVLQWDCYGNAEYDLFDERNADYITAGLDLIVTFKAM